MRISYRRFLLVVEVKTDPVSCFRLTYRIMNAWAYHCGVLCQNERHPNVRIFSSCHSQVRNAMVGPSLPAHRILVNDLCSWPGWDIFNSTTTTSGAARPQAPAENRLKVAVRAGEKVFHAERQQPWQGLQTQQTNRFGARFRHRVRLVRSHANSLNSYPQQIIRSCCWAAITT